MLPDAFRKPSFPEQLNVKSAAQPGPAPSDILFSKCLNYVRIVTERVRTWRKPRKTETTAAPESISLSTRRCLRSTSWAARVVVELLCEMGGDKSVGCHCTLWISYLL
ncbi:hypothetical protein GN956_G17742 [Arapaima gigas]